MPRALAKMPEPEPLPVVEQRVPDAPQVPDGPEEVVYPWPVVRIHAVGGDRDPIDEAFAIRLLGWETEKQYAEKMLAKHPPEERKLYSYGFGEMYDFKDMNNDKIKCFNNAGNRELVRDHCLSLAQDILTRNWADSRNGGTTKCKYVGGEDLIAPDGTVLSDGQEVDLPEMTINGETIIVTRCGNVASAQHRLIGFVFACQMWHRGELWNGIDPRHHWPDGPPTLEAVIFYGMSDSPRVVMTLDNVLPRREEDTIYTSKSFANCTTTEKRDMSRMLAVATDLLWKRTGVEGLYQTHSMSMNFRRRHPSLEKCVRHVYEENRERPISKLGLSPGACAGLQYLYAASKTDEKYGQADPMDRDESLINFRKQVAAGGKKKAAWDAAELFTSLLASSGATQGADPTLSAVSQEMFRIAKDTGNRASSAEQKGMLCIAWNLWSGGSQVTQDALNLDKVGAYRTRDDGSKFIADHPNVGGIDQGVKVRAEAETSADPTPEEIAAEKKRKQDDLARQNAETNKSLVLAAQQKKARMAGTAAPTGESLKEEAARVAKAQEDKLRLIREAAERQKAKNGSKTAAGAPAPAK